MVSYSSVITVNFRIGEDFFDVFREGANLSSGNVSIALDIDTPVVSLTPKSLEQAKVSVVREWKPWTIVVSNECVMTYAGLLGIRKYRNDKPFGLVVCDQHLDIYAYDYCGTELNKATVIRKSLDDGLVDRVVFIGTRPSEEACYRETDYPIPAHDRQYSAHIREDRILSGHEDKISIIPVYQFGTFSEGAMKAFFLLRALGITDVGLMVDLDSFDSRRIRGVAYNSDYSAEIQDFITERIREKSKLPDLPVLKEIIEYLMFMESEISQPGIPPDNIGQEISIVRDFLRSQGMRLLYKGITEYEPSRKDKATKRLLEQIVRALV
ncbi:hypothetical protein A2Z33_03705 [Candidatus Gottesmanbacteria bacterium RBG_16_52_11]|uniref:Arginase n=1 Tax=Candidatus Gottesmanbacteria bacterium RBG_16_52_11 TaxID=1798374 RepID=A0A1F5YVL4_9BACT|nr:MAG: hypothetical protein A2Z33_03705 [Candidatus Gottesmanbacteria bacterium RBG_16_52_11]